MRASLRAWLLRPPGWVFHLSLALLVALTLVWASVPGGSVPHLAYLFAWPLVALAWTLRITLRNLLALRLPPGAAATADPFRLWILGPALMGLTLVAVGLEWPLRTRFALSRAAFDRDADGLLERGELHDPSRVRIGSYTVRWRSVEDGRVRYGVEDAGSMSATDGFERAAAGSGVSGELGGGWSTSSVPSGGNGPED